MRSPALPLHVLLGAIATAITTAATLGCTGQVFSKGPGDTSDAAPGEDASGPDGSPARDGGPSDAGPGPGPCPAAAPANGSACTIDGLQCEYGQSEYPGCDTLVTCASGVWGGAVGSGFCPPPNGSDCPPSMAAANGSSCNPGTAGSRSCFYPTGGCYCGSLGGPVPIELDGAIPPQKWQCDNPGPSCALPRPRVGSACTQEGLTCQYLECNFAQICQNGRWVDQPEGCAVAGGAASP